MNKLMLPLVAVLTAAGLGTAGDAEKDLKKLVGTWEEVSHVANGKAKPAAEVKGHTVVIDSAGKWEAFKDGTSLLKGTVKLDPAKKPRAPTGRSTGPTWWPRASTRWTATRGNTASR